MALNPYFDNKRVVGTQRLIEDMTIEAIKATGINVVYIVKTVNSLDGLFGEDSTSKLKYGFTIEMYSQNVRTFDGNEKDIINKFGIEMKDNVSLIVSKHRWAQEASKLPDLENRLHPKERPMEGDIIYLPYAPASRNLYEIKFVDHENMFFQQGDYYTYRLDCELFKYSMEDMQTGFDEVDKLKNESVQTVTDENGTYFVDQKKISDNILVQGLGNSYIDFSEFDPFSEGNY